MASTDEFTAFCAELQLDNGAPMELEPFQRKILADCFAGARDELHGAIVGQVPHAERTSDSSGQAVAD